MKVTEIRLSHAGGIIRLIRHTESLEFALNGTTKAIVSFDDQTVQIAALFTPYLGYPIPPVAHNPADLAEFVKWGETFRNLLDAIDLLR